MRLLFYSAFVLLSYCFYFLFLFFGLFCLIVLFDHLAEKGARRQADYIRAADVWE